MQKRRNAEHVFLKLLYMWSTNDTEKKLKMKLCLYDADNVII